MKNILVNNNCDIEFKLDSGAEVSCLPLHIFKKLKLQKNVIKNTNVSLHSYGNPNFNWKPIGEVDLICESHSNKCVVRFVLIDSLETPLLGLDACVDLGLIKSTDSVNLDHFKTLKDLKAHYSEVFKGLGKFPQIHRITVDKSIVPKIHPIRRVPLALHERLKNKLNELEKMKVIRKVTKPTEWLNPLVIIEKVNGDLRLCLDSRDINKAIRREHFLIPTIDDIAIKLGKNKFFTVLDMKDGYLQIPIDEESSDLCSFASPFGRY